jgi:hypothetical protein
VAGRPGPEAAASTWSNRALACEVAAFEAAHSAGLRVPRAYEQVVMDGGPGLAMERLEGTDLLSVLGQKPWLVFRSGRLTGEIQARINGARAPASLPTVREVMRDALARLAHREPAALADCAARILGRLPDGEALCHGDFHPGQLILSNGQCATFDWAGAQARRLSLRLRAHQGLAPHG